MTQPVVSISDRFSHPIAAADLHHYLEIPDSTELVDWQDVLVEFGKLAHRLMSPMDLVIARIELERTMVQRTGLPPYLAHQLVESVLQNLVANQAYKWKSLDDLRNTPAPEDLVAGLISLESTAEIYGGSGHSKSHVAVGLLMSVASGVPFHGHEVKQGPAAYVAAEGASRIITRFDAWLEAHGRPEVAPVRVLGEPVQLLEQGAVEALLESFDPVPVLIVIDTVSQCIASKNENAPEVMSGVIHAANVIKRATGATVILIHHSGHNPSHERGHTSLRGGVDTVIKVTMDDDIISLKCDKQRDRERFDTIKLQLLPLGQSCYLDTVDHTSDNYRLSKSERHALEVLVSSALDDGMASTVWFQCCEIPKSTFHLAKKRLVEGGYVRKDGTRFHPTDSAHQTLSPKGVPF
jgi:hypothetical protein